MRLCFDLSRPIEAVHEDGRTSPAFIDSPGDMLTLPVVKVQALKFLCPVLDDMTICTAPTWRIRNVAEPQAEAPTAPSGAEVGPEVVERMVVVIQAYANNDPSRIVSGNSIYAELVELNALLPEAVDPDEAEAIDMLAHSFVPQDDEARMLALRCIKRGRTLAAQSTHRSEGE